MTLALKKDSPNVNEIQLNQKQKLAINKINEFVTQTKHKYFYLLGYAGTGKTFLISKIVREFLFSNRMDHIFVCAPTHQALYVIESYLKSNLAPNEQINFLSKMSFMTIHKLLEFRPVIMAEDGSKIFKSNRESKFLKLMEDKLIIIDECSMISKEMVTELNKYIDLYPLKIVFMGDSAQLPPVGEPKSIIFSTIPENYPFYVLLDEIMRTNSPEIKEVATIIRNWNQKDILAKLLLPVHNKKKAFKLYHKKIDYVKTTWFRTFINKLDHGKTPIILTWRNETADMYNLMIRKYVHKTDNLKNYIVGDYAIFNNYYSCEDGCTFYTANMIKILEIKMDKKILFDWENVLIAEPKTMVDKGYNLLVKKLSKLKNKITVDTFTVERIYSDVGYVPASLNGKTSVIQTVNRDDLESYRELLKNIHEHIEFFHRKNKSEPHSNKLWDIYHKKLTEPYAQISFGFSLTAHKSQGSTFDHVFVDVDDMSQNPDLNEIQRMLYTAGTRGSKELGFILG